MGLDLYMVGLQCRDFERSLEFYRRLGLAVPDMRESQTHIEMSMRN
jgi:catechol 2,3-dioxygenase-like lactoylglutathione lyase family enzyme